jgi:histidine ammonia-lyase
LSDARRLHDLSLSVAALSFEAVASDPVVLAGRVQKARSSTAQTAVAARMRELLGLADSPSPPEGDHSEAPQIHPQQVPYPFRVLPQVDGVFAGALSALEDVVSRELNARSENALIDDGQPWPNGNFHAAELASALDAARAALAGSASLIAARLSSLLDPRVTNLVPFLAGIPGLDCGLMMLEYTAHDAASEARSRAAPAGGQSAWVSLGIESHASLAAGSARRLGEQLADLRVLIASELLAAMRAFELSGRRPHGPGTVPLYHAAAAALPTGRHDRDFGADVQAVLEFLARTSNST